MKNFELFPKEWTATHAGHAIRVRNSWNRGLKLYVDDVCQTATSRLFSISRSRPVLRHQFVAEHSSFLIEVFCVAWLRVKVKIVVAGQQIGGDAF